MADESDVLKKLAHFLANVSDAWKEASQEQRNKLARSLFEQIHVEDSRIVLVKPRPELEPFFRLDLECHTRDIGCDPGGVRDLIFNIWKLGFSLLSYLILLVLGIRYIPLFGHSFLSNTRLKASAV